MGRLEDGTTKLFYEFSLEDLVPQGHLLRKIDPFLNFDDLRAFLNLAYRWFCQLGIKDVVPNHSTFSKARHGQFRKSDLFRKLFEQVVLRCMSNGLMRANASEARAVDRGDPVDWSDPQIASRPLTEYLEAIDHARDEEEARRKKIP